MLRKYGTKTLPVEILPMTKNMVVVKDYPKQAREKIADLEAEIEKELNYKNPDVKRIQNCKTIIQNIKAGLNRNSR